MPGSCTLKTFLVLRLWQLSRDFSDVRADSPFHFFANPSSPLSRMALRSHPSFQLTFRMQFFVRAFGKELKRRGLLDLLQSAFGLLTVKEGERRSRGPKGLA